MTRWLALLLLAAPLAAGAQAIPDTTAPWRYYPLGLGDVWHYDVEVHYGIYCSPCRYKLVVDVTGAEVVDGREYAVLRTRSYDVPSMPNAPPPLRISRVRFDTAAATAVRYAGQEFFVDHVGCRLDEPFPAAPDSPRPITCPNGPDAPWDTATVRGGYDLPLPAGGTAAQKTFVAPGVLAWHVTYAADLGILTRTAFFDLDRTDETLRYARIGGVEYGTPLVTVSADPQAADLRLAVGAHPNPAAGPISLHVTLPSAGSIAVEVFDTLGRRVWHEAAERAAGRHAIPLETSRWASGLYVVRVSAGTDVATARVTVR